MKNILFLLAILSMFILSSCDKKIDNYDSSLLLGEWKLSCENSNADFVTYRHPDDNNISTCRGLLYYNFKEDGRFSNSTFFCTLSETLEGNWTYDGKKIVLNFDDKTKTELLIYEVKRLNEKILEIKK